MPDQVRHDIFTYPVESRPSYRAGGFSLHDPVIALNAE